MADTQAGTGRQRPTGAARKNTGRRSSSPGKRKNDAADEPERGNVAIIYLPHVGHSDAPTTEDLAARISSALAGTADGITFETKDAGRTVRYGERRPKNSARSSSVIATTKGGKRSSLDIYEFQYSRSLGEAYEGASPLSKSLRLLTTVVFNSGRLIASLFSGRTDENHKNLARVAVWIAFILTAFALAFAFPEPNEWAVSPWILGITGVVAAVLLWRLRNDRGKPRPHRTLLIALLGTAGLLGGLMLLEAVDGSDGVVALGWTLLALGTVAVDYAALKLANPDLGQRVQIGIGFGILSLFAMYGIVLLAAVITQVTDALDDNGAVVDAAETAADPLTAVALGLTAAGVAVSAKDLRQKIVDGTLHLLGAVRYLSMGDGIDVQVSRLNHLVVQLDRLGYKRIDLVAYSFGSVIALDALYPRKDSETTLPMMNLVDHLVTIGCPAKTIGTFWPQHWEDRSLAWQKTAPPDAPRWFNVYSPFDVLSSKFLEDGNAGDAGPTLASATTRFLAPKAASEDEEAPAAEVSVPFPSEEAAFALGPSARDLSPLQMLALQGLRAHASYWCTPFNDDLGAVALFAHLWHMPDWGHGTVDRSPPATEAAPEPPENRAGAAEVRDDGVAPPEGEGVAVDAAPVDAP